MVSSVGPREVVRRMEVLHQSAGDDRAISAAHHRDEVRLTVKLPHADAVEALLKSVGTFTRDRTMDRVGAHTFLIPSGTPLYALLANYKTGTTGSIPVVHPGGWTHQP